MTITVGMIGTIELLNNKGDALIKFDDLPGKQWVFERNFYKLKILEAIHAWGAEGATIDEGGTGHTGTRPTNDDRASWKDNKMFERAGSSKFNVGDKVKRKTTGATGVVQSVDQDGDPEVLFETGEQKGDAFVLLAKDVELVEEEAWNVIESWGCAKCDLRDFRCNIDFKFCPNCGHRKGPPPLPSPQMSTFPEPSDRSARKSTPKATPKIRKSTSNATPKATPQQTFPEVTRSDPSGLNVHISHHAHQHSILDGSNPQLMQMVTLDGPDMRAIPELETDSSMYGSSGSDESDRDGVLEFGISNKDVIWE